MVNRFNVYITAEEKEKLVKKAAKLDMSVSQLLVRGGLLYKKYEQTRPDRGRR